MKEDIHISTLWLARVLYFSLPLLVSVDSYAQAPCPDQAALKNETDRLCKEILPASGRIWFMDDQQGPCHCTCDPVYSVVDSIMIFRKERGIRYRQLMKDWGAAFSGPPLRGGTSGHGTSGGTRAATTTEHPSGALVSIDNSCAKDEVLRAAVIKCLDQFDAGALTHLVVEQYHLMEGCDGTYPDIIGKIYFDRVGSTGSDVYVRITIPSSFNRHPAVGSELMEFMIMHELGHIYGYRPGLSACEWFADVHATQVGMRDLYPTADVFRVMNEVSAQLFAYQLALIDPDESALSCFGTMAECTNVYPTTHCRTELLHSALSSTLAASPPESWVTDWLVEATRDCWSPAIGTMVIDPTTFCGTDCGAGISEEMSAGYDHFLHFHELLGEIHSSELRMLDLSHAMNSDICERYPSACAEDPLVRTPPPGIWRRRIKHYNRRAERLKERAIKLEDQLRDPPTGFWLW